MKFIFINKKPMQSFAQKYITLAKIFIFYRNFSIFLSVLFSANLVPQVKKYTLRDIAKELNISASTASRALHDNPRISALVRRQVKELAKSMDYQPDFRAMSLRRGSGRTIGVLLPQVDRYFFASVLRGIDEISTEEGYNVLICQSYESLQKEEDLARSLLNGRIDGLLASVSIETRVGPHFEQYVSKGLPLVFFDRALDYLKVSKVVLDDYKGAYQAVQHLIDSGCRRIAHFAGPGHIEIYANRAGGYIDALTKNGIQVDPELIFSGVITQEAGCRAMKRLMEMGVKFDAIFSSGDYSALGAMVCAQQNGIDIPRDLSIIGFSNEPFGALIQPTLSSIDQHALEMGRQAATLLISEINLKNKNQTVFPRKIILDPQLVIRNSTR